MTKIFTTKKLEKIIHEKIENSHLTVEKNLGNWNATVLHIAKKKCILISNAETFFSVIIPRFSVKDIDKIGDMFIENLYNQLLYENINIEFKTIFSIIGNIRFYSTNNNRQMTGILNYNVEKLNYFKYEYPIFNSSVIREMTEKLNKTPFKQLNWKVPHEEIVTILNKIEKASV
ncbi:DUF6933 domain-containing protein [Wenyingzhuangia sp. IMCC45533]